MVLKFNTAWRFSPPEDGRFRNRTIPDNMIEEFIAMINKVATQGSRKGVLEHFKLHFCIATSKTHVKSSDESWAESDLKRDMSEAAGNAPLFIEALSDALEALRNRFPDWYVPNENIINQLLSKHNLGYAIQSSNLVLREREIPPIPVLDPPQTLEERAVELFHSSLSRSEQLLSEGHPREAVQEILWLLETVTTAFRGIETESGLVEGKYFNQIVRDLKAKRSGTTLDRVLDWVTSVHGYLSSPTGGGVRHGLDLGKGVELGPNEARLFCNLIRSYLSFLLAEHERLNK